jgi:acyl-CoA synthetase (AMP-forming)/AMP-acid ligase II
VLTADGWYHTSDAGFLDAQGHLKIIDRVKDVGRMMGGANDGAMFAPKYVENKLKFFPHIKEVVAYGDKREKVCVMINIDFDAVGNWAERATCPTPATPTWRRSPRSTSSSVNVWKRSTPTSPPTPCWRAARSAASWCCTRSWMPTTAS